MVCLENEGLSKRSAQMVMPVSDPGGIPPSFGWQELLWTTLFLLVFGLGMYAVMKIPWVRDMVWFMLSGVFDHCKQDPSCCHSMCL
jgi:hypothetical protein